MNHQIFQVLGLNLKFLPGSISAFEFILLLNIFISDRICDAGITVSQAEGANNWNSKVLDAPLATFF